MIFSSRKIPQSLKTAVFNRVLPTATYGAETWTSVKQRAQIKMTQRAMKRDMLLISLADRVWKFYREYAYSMQVDALRSSSIGGQDTWPD